MQRLEFIISIDSNFKNQNNEKNYFKFYANIIYFHFM